MIYSWSIVVGDRCLTGSFHVEEALLGNLHTDSHDALDGLVLSLCSCGDMGQLHSSESAALKLEIRQLILFSPNNFREIVGKRKCCF